MSQGGPEQPKRGRYDPWTVDEALEQDLRFLVDECLPDKLAAALRCLGEPAVYIFELYNPDEYRQRGKGLKDTQWLEELAQRPGWILLTEDGNAGRKRAESEAFAANNWLGYTFRTGQMKNILKFSHIAGLWMDVKLHINQDPARPCMYIVESAKRFTPIGRSKGKH